MSEGETKKKKSHKKAWIVAGSIVGSLAVAALAAWGIIALLFNDPPLEQDWAQTYYVYLDEHPLEAELTDAEGEVIANADEYEVAFYDVEGVAEPVMAVSYVAEDITYLTYYWVEGADGVKRAVMYNPSEIELLYNIKSEKSEYYIHYETDGADYYKSLSGEILGMQDAEDAAHVKETPEYKFTDDDVLTVTDKDGKEYALTKFEQTFVELEDDTETTVLPVDYDKKELKAALKDESYEYQILQEVARKQAEMIRQVIEDIESREQKIADVEKENAEIEAQKKAEEEAKRAAEEAKKGLQLEGKTLAWGRYKLDEEWFGPNSDYVVINQDGTCTYDGNPCTWHRDRKDYAQSPESAGKYIHDSICFRKSENFSYGCYYAYANNKFGDGDITLYTYVGK